MIDCRINDLQLKFGLINRFYTEIESALAVEPKLHFFSQSEDERRLKPTGTLWQISRKCTNISWQAPQ